MNWVTHNTIETAFRARHARTSANAGRIPAVGPTDGSWSRQFTGTFASLGAAAGSGIAMPCYMFRCAGDTDTATPDDLYQRVFRAITEMRCAHLDIVMHLERLLVMEDHDGPIVLASLSGPDGWHDAMGVLMDRHRISCCQCA